MGQSLADRYAHLTYPYEIMCAYTGEQLTMTEFRQEMRTYADSVGAVAYENYSTNGVRNMDIINFDPSQDVEARDLMMDVLESPSVQLHSQKVCTEDTIQIDSIYQFQMAVIDSVKSVSVQLDIPSVPMQLDRIPCKPCLLEEYSYYSQNALRREHSRVVRLKKEATGTEREELELRRQAITLAYRQQGYRGKVHKTIPPSSGGQVSVKLVGGTSKRSIRKKQNRSNCRK